MWPPRVCRAAIVPVKNYLKHVRADPKVTNFSSGLLGCPHFLRVQGHIDYRPKPGTGKKKSIDLKNSVEVDVCVCVLFICFVYCQVRRIKSLLTVRKETEQAVNGDVISCTAHHLKDKNGGSTSSVICHTGSTTHSLASRLKKTSKGPSLPSTLVRPKG